MQTIRIEKKGNYAIVKLDRGTANTIDQVMVDELRTVLKELSIDPEIKGMILTGKAKFFSAGLDLITLFDYDEKEIAHFWESFLGLITDLASFPKALVAAISGHAPAGGCLMAIAADYRVMAEGKYTIGLNEVAVGIIVPEMVHKLFSFWIGNGKSYSMLLEGALVGPTEAKAIGLINEVAAEDEVIIRAEKQLKKYMGFHPVTWKKSKANLRTNLLKSMEYDFDSIFAPALKLWWEPTSRAMMKMIVDGMKAKKTEKKVS